MARSPGGAGELGATLQVAALPAPARSGRSGRAGGHVQTGGRPIATPDPRRRLHSELWALKAEADAARRKQDLRPLSQAEIERTLRQAPYRIADFRGQRVSDWVPKDVRQAQAPSADSADALWALVRLWSETAGRPPRTQQYWAGLAEAARDASPAAASAPAFGANGMVGAARVPEYDLDRLGEQAFGQLVRLLLLAEAGGRVGLDHTAPADLHLPDGTEVICWFAPPSARRGDLPPSAWLPELAIELDKRGLSARRVLVCTNLPSATNHTSRFRSRSTVAPVKHQLTAYGLQGLRVLYQEDIRVRLHARADLRRLFAGFVAPVDPLARIGEFIDADAVRETAQLVHAHTAAELLSDQWVRLGQAGAEGDRQRLSLGTVAIDLDATISSGGTETAVQSARRIIERGDHVLRPSSRPAEAGLLNVALIGGPGQGKSTLGQLVCQAYRAALLGEDGAVLLSFTARDLLRTLHNDLRAAGIPRPRVRRWPIRIALHDFANHLATGGDRSILRFLTSRMGRQLTGSLSPERLGRWLAEWPWFLVLDGLDEVASPEVREEVMTAIEEFLVHVRQLDADHLILATTRPQGYRGEFHVGDFEQLRLSPLSPDAAMHYAQRLADARHADDPEMREAVVTRFGEAARQPNTARLMSSPLQVTIMSLLVERRTRMPQNRFELFEAYYSTIYAREVDKPGENGRLLAEHKGHIDWMHQCVGLTLQSRAGLADALDSVMPERELRERSRARIADETEDPGLSAELAPKLFNAATERLVLLVAPEAEMVGFEVRSLQEFMAAKALISGPEADILPRLQRLAGQPAWHHTWLLAAAGIFTQRPHLRDGLITVLRAADTEDRVTMTVRPGLALAASLVEDDLARAHPRHHRLLVAHACEVLKGPIGPTFPAAADALVKVADQNDGASEVVLLAVTNAVRSRDVGLVTGLALLQHWATTNCGSRTAAAERLDRALEALDSSSRAAVLASDLPGLPPLGSIEFQRFLHQYYPVAATQPLTRLFTEHGRPDLKEFQAFVRTVVQVGTDGTELHLLPTLPPPLLTGDLLAPLAAAVDARSLTSWPLASQLLTWLTASAAACAGELPPPQVEGIN
ncbi:NACHT domain-containing protein [Kitasatospora sp. NPDC004615]|uniref:NACHT domain-containing protein n=1 Tax=Kitasatospora sp. NPDC004615 TaxID=3364017 RepID=UPI0036A714EB